jgi:3-phytase/alkaline phosphatase D
MSRFTPIRPLLIASAALLLALAVSAQPAAPAHSTENSTLPNGVAAGDITATRVVLWARTTFSGEVRFTVDGRTFTAAVDDPLIPARVTVDGLTPNTRYTYTVTDAYGTTMSGVFRTPAATGERAGLRFGVSGDWRGELAPYPAISNADERDLAFFIALGDTIYADYPSPAVPVAQAVSLDDFRRKHAEVYSPRYGLNTLADLRASTAIYALIDDHEVTNDFAGGAAPAASAVLAMYPDEYSNDTALYERGLEAFQQYNPLRDLYYATPDDPRMDGERRLYRYQTFGSDAAIFLVDARSFRDAGLPPVTALDDAAIAAFLAATDDPTRTMLGGAQLRDLLADLLDAQQRGITWKFVFIPEPIQQFGVIGASDRFEGYNAERTALLRYIVENDITNVVFVAADIHGTVVNDIFYRERASGDPIPVNAFEITTGPVAFDAPFGQTVMGLAYQLGFLTDDQYRLYTGLPLSGREFFIYQLLAAQFEPLGLSPVGLEGSNLRFDNERGSWLATHTYGWTEFEIDAVTQRLRVTTFGIPPYSQAELEADPMAIAARTPAAIQVFTVDPQ